MDLVVPPRGTPVQYFANGDMRRPPLAAIVVDAQGTGMIRVQMFHPQGGHSSDRASVHHKSDPRAWDDRGNPSPSAVRHGIWDYHPWLLPPTGYEAPAPKRDKRWHENWSNREKEDRVLKWAEGHTFDEVCKKAAPLGFTRARVESIYRLNELLEEADAE